MTLVGFHRVLILTAIAFCLGFSAWELRAYTRLGADGGALVLAATFALLGILLAAYLVRLGSILGLKE